MKKISRTIAIGLLALTAAGQAQAISRYASRSMSCEAATAAVRKEGAVILRYPSARVPGMTLYDRYVRSRDQCGAYEYAERKTVPTADDPKCPLLACVPRTDDDVWLRP